MKSLVKIVLMSIAGLFLLVMSLGAFSKFKQQEDIGSWDDLPGRWEVTDITGYIHTTVPGGTLWCDKVDTFFIPIVNRERTYISFTNEVQKPKLEKFPSAIIDTMMLVENPEGLFVYQFSFGGSSDITNDAIEAFMVPYQYIEMIKGIWSLRVGYWGEVDKLEFSKKGIINYLPETGIIMIGKNIDATKWGGKNEFSVFGKLVSDSRIEGTWKYEGKDGGPIDIPECFSKSNGFGTWVAVKK